ncbi:MAG TPA: glycoside hydrolase family 95 protein [Puia sp.]|nr:glycoside hydrolase family 95 protein [Puia sp.]
MLKKHFILPIYLVQALMITATAQPSTSPVSFVQPPPLRLWYDRPARQWEETLPLGNGRLGMMPDGGVAKEKIVLNDITLWSGSPQDANNYDAYKKLPEIRQLLLAGKNEEAQKIVDQFFICKGKGSGGAQWGCFQTLGDLDIAYKYKDTGYSDYQRELSLDDAIARCHYKVGNTTYTREYFTSFGDDVDMIRLTADKPGGVNIRLSMHRPERAAVSTEGNTLVMEGQLDNGIDGKGMRYRACLEISQKGGQSHADKDALDVQGATEVIVFLSAGTDWRDPDYKETIRKTMTAAKNKAYAVQRQRHIAHYRQLFDRVHFQLGAPAADDSLTTDKRIIAFRSPGGADMGLPSLFYQFGRYLSISSTRVGLLPPNLQGLWANQLQTPWNGDWHLDINVQMNHWPVEVSNLSELDLPLADLVQRMVPNGERTAKAYYNAEGWVAHVITNLWSFTEPGESASWGVTKCGSGWLCNNLWEHYAFTNDTSYLARIYPILKGSAQFYKSMLITDPKTGWLVTAPSSSPENWFTLPNGSSASICMGPTIDNQIIRELFNHVIAASTLLDKDAALRDTLTKDLALLPPPGRIARDGRLMEWMEEYKEPEPQHRHVSHLYGLFPADLITPETTPDLAEACKKTLEVRGDDGPSWSIAYKLLWWARLHDGNRAYKLLRELLKSTLKTNINYGAGGGIYPNLLSAGPPFQIDGNFGATAGIAEMLLQSHAGFIELLPAIPDAWKSSGSIEGLKARGNFTVDMQWKDGMITHYRISSPTPQKVKVKINGEIKEVLSERL